MVSVFGGPNMHIILKNISSEIVTEFAFRMGIPTTMFHICIPEYRLNQILKVLYVCIHNRPRCEIQWNPGIISTYISIFISSILTLYKTVYTYLCMETYFRRNISLSLPNTFKLLHGVLIIMCYDTDIGLLGCTLPVCTIVKRVLHFKLSSG